MYVFSINKIEKKPWKNKYKSNLPLKKIKIYFQQKVSSIALHDINIIILKNNFNQNLFALGLISNTIICIFFLINIINLFTLLTLNRTSFCYFKDIKTKNLSL